MLIKIKICLFNVIYVLYINFELRKGIYLFLVKCKWVMDLFFIDLNFIFVVNIFCRCLIYFIYLNYEMFYL